MGKSSKQTTGYWYKLAYHAGLGIGPIDAFLEFRGGDKTAWSGEITASSSIYINQPNLWGGEKDQGGIVSFVDVLFGDAAQVPSSYLINTFGSQIPAWRGLATLIFKGGRYGANNPYPQPASYKIRKIKQGWTDDTCWYPEKAEVPVTFYGAPGDVLGADTLSWLPLSEDFTDAKGLTWTRSASMDPANTHISGGACYFSGRFDFFGAYLQSDDSIGALNDFTIRARIKPDAGTYTQPLTIYSNDSGFLDIYFVLDTDLKLSASRTGVFASLGSTSSISTSVETDVMLIKKGATASLWINGVQDASIAASTAITTESVFGHCIGRTSGAESNYYIGTIRNFTICGADAQGKLFGMNPAHVLYYSRTNEFIGREPTANINDTSLRAAADQLYAEGFGICTEYDPANESGIDFENRICKLIGGSFTRSLVDGLWYLDLARGDYVLDDLPILNDDDILDFSEQPTVQDSAANSISVKYFDPALKEDIITSPVQALGLIDAFGTITQVSDYPEIPIAGLAAIVALRDLKSNVTPSRTFALKTTRKPYAWRPNTYFRLQSPKRGIADMVCLLGEKSAGTLKSGAIAINAAQDIYSLPSASYVDYEPGVDTRPDQTPVAITTELVFEAPYFTLAGALSRADLNALPNDVGFLLAVAVDPSVSRNYTLEVSTGGSYTNEGNGDWCPSALIVEASTTRVETSFTLSGGTLLDGVLVGSAALWDGEIVRVDAIDSTVGTLTLGRGCADTPPLLHSAGARIWFFDDNSGADSTEYTDAETVNAKLLTNTGSQQLPIASATALPLTFAGRQSLPYPPANVKIGGVLWPTSLTGAIVTTYDHRDRVMQADNLVAWAEASIGPEVGTSYTQRIYIDSILLDTQSGLAGNPASFDPSINGTIRIEIEASRDGLSSLHMIVVECPYTATPAAHQRVTSDGSLRRTSFGNRRIYSP